MRKSKRIISLLTALCLTLGLCPASAAEGRTVSVGTARELIALSESCTLDTWSQGLTVELTADIDLGNAAFRPIPIFCGVFEGNGHRISGLRVTGKGSDQGLFRYLKEGAVVRNLELEGEILPEGTKSGLGLLCGRNEGTVTGVTVSGTVSGEEDVGGLVGVNEATGVLRQCENQAQITGVTHTGGIAGRNEGTIEACINRGAIDPDANDDAQDTGGIAGRSSGTITGSVNHGEIGYPHTGYNVGGIAGRQNGSVVGCENYGSIWGRKDVGGIVGQFEPYTVLTYGEDPMQRLDDELSRLSGLMTRLTDQISGYSGDAVDDLKAVSGAMDAIRERPPIPQGPTAGRTPRRLERRSTTRLRSSTGRWGHFWTIRRPSPRRRTGISPSWATPWTRSVTAWTRALPLWTARPMRRGSHWMPRSGIWKFRPDASARPSRRSAPTLTPWMGWCGPREVC